ncbi:Uu.00g086540.m01.CDS01 [Anthostomella pinea]|uniref:L-serine ammonia-lyase n=1 Tax=Anthostomella pinea TaxID=933095 RepID=A0AAI8VM87_9PEZI|nr:Uu.00g086540.m01.CDS01 [Anthostomella pinea]
MGSSYAPEPQKLYIETPCIPSAPLSRAAGCNIFLKLENLQPSGSFKSRGVGSMMHRALLAKPDGRAHFYCSSGGNAGLACATAAATLAQSCTIVVPTLTAAHMIAKMRLLGATVEQVGENWSFADKYLREELLARDTEHGVYVPPFDHPHVWEGASTIVDELVTQTRGLMAGGAAKVDGIICNCGGGGLLNGIMEGVGKNFRGSKPTVLAVETVGADSLDASVRAGELVTLPAITSIATSLGAPRVSAKTFEWTREKHLLNTVVTDAEAVMGCVKLANDARMLVEASCGATIAPVYNGGLRKAMGEGLSDEEWSRKNVVAIVCGGTDVTLQILRDYQKKFGVE